MCGHDLSIMLPWKTHCPHINQNALNNVRNMLASFQRGKTRTRDTTTYAIFKTIEKMPATYTLFGEEIDSAPPFDISVKTN